MPGPSLPMLRSGECSRCGSCCAGDPFRGELGEATVPGMCPLYRVEADGRGACSDRANAYYLSACAGWPYHVGNVVEHARCSYVFGVAA